MDTELCPINMIFNNADFYNKVYNIKSLDEQNELKTGSKILKLHRYNPFFGLQRSHVPKKIFSHHGKNKASL